MKIPQIRKLFKNNGIKYSYCFSEFYFSLESDYKIIEGDRHDDNMCSLHVLVNDVKVGFFHFNLIEINEQFICFCNGESKYFAIR